MADRENLHQSLLREDQRYQSRRWFFKECGVGLGSVALHSLLGSVLGGGTAHAGSLTPDRVKADRATRSPRKRRISRRRRSA